jgi:hypothetical protein
VLTPESSKRISSRSTFFMKRVFPLLWFGLIAVFVIIALTASDHAKRGTPAAVFFVVPVIMVIVGYAVMRRLVFDLADEVYDEGDALRVRFGADEERVRLDNIINISYAGMINPPRVTLTLRSAGRFGREVSFSPPQTFLGPLLRSGHPIVTDLIERVDAARRR